MFESAGADAGLDVLHTDEPVAEIVSKTQPSSAINKYAHSGLQAAGFVNTLDTWQPEMFSSYRQFGEMWVSAFSSSPGRPVIPRRSRPWSGIVQEQAPTLVLDSVMTMDERLMSSLARPRGYALVVGGIAAFALAIAAVSSAYFCTVSPLD